MKALIEFQETTKDVYQEQLNEIKYISEHFDNLLDSVEFIKLCFDELDNIEFIKNKVSNDLKIINYLIYEQLNN